LVLFKVQRDADSFRTEFNQFAGHDIFQAVNAGNAVTNSDDGAGFGHIGDRIEIFNLCQQYARDFVCSDLSHSFLIL
jgi:hypothetical protein